jgi:ESX secretion-associated protein EspK
MGITKPTGGHAEQMLEPGGWPEVDEGTLYDRADEYAQVLRQVTEVLEICRHQQTEVFDGGVWSGGAADAANGELGTEIGELVTLQNGLATVITWDRHVALSIVQAKSDITDNVEAAHTQIAVLERDSRLDAAERNTAINNVVITTYGANVTVMEGTAERILASKSWKPPSNALEDLLDQKTPPPVTLPDTSVPSPPVEEEGPLPGPPQPAPVTPPPVMPVSPPQPSPGVPSPSPPPTAVAPPTPGTAPTTGQPAAPAPGVPGGPGGGAAAPVSPASPLGPAAPAVPLSPAASTQLPGAGGGKGLAPASASMTSPSSGARTEESSPSVAPAAATGMPGAPMAGGSGGSSAGSGAGPGARSGAPVGQKSSGAPPPMRPAAAARAAARPAPSVQSKPTDPDDSADDVGVPPIIPVSTARAERDAIAEAATADAVRRRSGGSDRLTLARRIAAALNAPGSGAEGNLGFFWVTAVTTGGAIVVANSYGLAYIPDGVQLPEQVYMASADEAIPAAERARWATYPVMAVRGWADHHDTKLRAVIATEAQLANSDAGVAKIVLSPDDIPQTGAMVGRSRLQVVDPEAADRLAATGDPRLMDLLPPSPAAAGGAGPRPTSESTNSEAASALATSAAAGTVDPQQLLAALPATPSEAGVPADERPMLWFEVVKPLASKAAGRSAAHLRAFHRYSAHAQEAVLTEAHTAVDLVAQRSAVADWLYWKHLTGLLDAALGGTS